MRPPRLFAACTLLLVVATGCASTGDKPGLSGFEDLAQFTIKDLTLAHELALKATDEGAPFRARCYAALIEWLPPHGETIVPEVIGLASAYEVGAQLAARQSTGLIPEKVQADCAYVRNELRRFALRNAAKFAPIPGAGAVGTILK